MTNGALGKLFEHNNWANDQLIEACRALTDEQLDAKPLASPDWSLRQTLIHLVESQQGYLALLTLPPEARRDDPPPFAELAEAAARSGAGLLSLARGEQEAMEKPLRTTDGYRVDPWVVMLQSINHATDHRRQLVSMLGVLGVTPPRLDGWSFGEVRGALVRNST